MIDPLCPSRHAPAGMCPTCDLLTQARSEEKVKFTRIWQDNLPLIELRNYERGVNDGRQQALQSVEVTHARS